MVSPFPESPFSALADGWIAGSVLPQPLELEICTPGVPIVGQSDVGAALRGDLAR
jgi:hypothetical protein